MPPSGINPDIVPVGFAATEGPHAPVRRSRRWWLLCVALVLVAGGTASFVIGLVSAFGRADDVDGRSVAEGHVAGLGSEQWVPARFTAPEPGRYTVWLRTDGIHEEGSLDAVVAATNCRAEFADRTTSTFRGAVQGSSVRVGERSTVGTFVAPPGDVVVTCRMEPFGKRSRYERLRAPRDMVVVPGGPGGGIAAMAWIFGGVLAIGAGIVIGIRCRTGSVEPR